jgi:hypothetical protein
MQSIGTNIAGQGKGLLSQRTLSLVGLGQVALNAANPIPKLFAPNITVL